MKTLKIGDISKIYQISLDSLRYYERIGLIKPTRQSNQYREYEYVDLWKLNVIKQLRLLNFDFDTIKHYLNNRTLASSKAMLEETVTRIDEDITRLTALKRGLIESKAIIETYESLPIDGHVSIKPLPERHCIQVAEMVQSFSQVDYYFRKLQLKSNDQIPLIGNKTLCVFMPKDRLHLAEGFYSTVFSFHPTSHREFDFVLPAGSYLSVFYRGDHHQSREAALHLLEEAHRLGYQPMTDPFEICYLDIHETSDKSEYVTEVQLGIRA